MIVLPTDVLYGIGRMFQLIQSSSLGNDELKVVRTMDEAYAIMGIDVDNFQPIV